MKEIFNGNVSKETASMIKEMEASGGSPSTCYFNLGEVILLTNRNIVAYLPESTESPVEPSEATNLLGEAFKTMVDDGVEIFYDDRNGSLAVADIQIIYEEGTSNIVGVSIDSDITAEPIVWAASGGNEYSASCITFGDDPGEELFYWRTTV